MWCPSLILASGSHPYRYMQGKAQPEDGSEYLLGLRSMPYRPMKLETNI
jgi:hypothetical protein